MEERWRRNVFVCKEGAVERSQALSNSVLAVLPCPDRFAGLVVKASASGAEDPGSNIPACDRIFPHTSDLKIGTPVATLPGAWRHRISAGTGRPSVSML